MSVEQETVPVYRTTNITLAKALITFPGISLLRAEALPPVEGHATPLCEFVIISADPQQLGRLVDEHRSLPGGLMVRSIDFDKSGKIISEAIHAATR